MKKNPDPFSMHNTNLVPRVQHPPKSRTPKLDELPPGQMLGTNRDLSKTIVICVSCLKPIYILYLDMKRAPVPIGCEIVPKKADEPCPRCGSNFCRYNDKTKGAQYLTNHGWV